MKYFTINKITASGVFNENITSTNNKSNVCQPRDYSKDDSQHRVLLFTVNIFLREIKWLRGNVCNF